MSPETGKKKILIVDDEESYCEATAARLEKEGYQVTTAYTGEKGLQVVHTDPPDVILLDVFLPGEDGLALLKKLKRPIDRETGELSKTREIPVIVVTGRGEKMDDVFEMEEAAGFLTKPVDSKALLATIQKTLGKRKT